MGFQVVMAKLEKLRKRREEESGRAAKSQREAEEKLLEASFQSARQGHAAAADRNDNKDSTAGLVKLVHNGLAYVVDTVSMYQTRSGRSIQRSAASAAEPSVVKEMVRRMPVSSANTPPPHYPTELPLPGSTNL